MKNSRRFGWRVAMVCALFAGSVLPAFSGRPRLPVRTNFTVPDGPCDLALYQAATGKWFSRVLPGVGTRTVAPAPSLWDVQFGDASMIPVPGDYNGDGQADLALYRPTDGRWFIRTVTGDILAWGVQFGNRNMIPVPGDYNGSGRSDLALYNPLDGTWYIRTLLGDILAWGFQWGDRNMIPVPGDFNGDGYSDLALYHTGTGFWYIRSLAIAVPLAAIEAPQGDVLVWGLQWGDRNMIPVPGDFNGDGRADLAVYWPARGMWYILSATGEFLAWDLQFGGPGMIPVPGDFNGNGRSDLAVYTESSGHWYVRTLNDFLPASLFANPQGTILAWGEQWGGPGMHPVGAVVAAGERWDVVARLPGSIGVNIPYNADWVLEADFNGMSMGVWDKFFQQGLEALSVFPGRFGRMSVRLANGRIFFVKGRSLVGSVSTFGTPDHYAWTVPGLNVYNGSHKMRMEYRYAQRTLRFYWDGVLVGHWFFRIDTMPAPISRINVTRVRSGELRYRVAPLSN